MTNLIEKNLQNHITNQRKLEMKKYGRIKIYNQISNFLHDDKKIAFSLINHALAIIDDDIDKEFNNKQLDKAIFILNQSFNGAKISTKQNWEEDISKLGSILQRLDKNNFNNATNLLNEVVNYWKIEKRNLNRRNKILNSRDLDKLNLEIGKSIGLQFLYLLCPKLPMKEIEVIASEYGFAVKLADNISDLNEDIKNGYINISNENIKKYNLDILSIDKNNLLKYEKSEIKRIIQYYKNGDKLTDKTITRYPSQKRGLIFFKNISHSWLKQVFDIYKSINSFR